MSVQPELTDDRSDEAIRTALCDLVRAAEQRDLAIGNSWDVCDAGDKRWMVELTRVETDGDSFGDCEQPARYHE